MEAIPTALVQKAKKLNTRRSDKKSNTSRANNQKKDSPVGPHLFDC